MSIQTTMGTIWSTFEVGVSMKKQATGGADKMYIKLWIAAGRCGVRRVRGLAQESQRTQTRIEPCQAKMARACTGSGRDQERITVSVAIGWWLGAWKFGWGRIAAAGLAKRKCAGERWRRHR